MHARTTALIVSVCLCFSTLPAAGQFLVRTVNPEAVEFEGAALIEQGLGNFRAEIFVAGADPRRDFPVKTLDLSPDALQGDGRIRVDLKDRVLDVPNGQYVAVITATRSGGSVVSEPSEVFVLQQFYSPLERLEMQENERLWTKIAIAIGASLILVPLLFR